MKAILGWRFPSDASTGPRSRERGEEAGLTRYPNERQASTGPRSRERGESPLDPTEESSKSASTGPRSRERGEIGPLLKRAERYSPLQRGRAHVSAESILWIPVRASAYEAST